MTIKVSIDKDRCVGCGLCAGMDSDVFEIVDGKARVKKEKISGEKIEQIKQIANMCPRQAIKIEEEN